MKALVVYDSLYGNTEKIAQAIAEGLTDAIGTPENVVPVNVGNADPDQLTGVELLVVGSPTHGSRPSPPMHEFLNRIHDGTLAGVKVAGFDTRTDMKELTGLARMFGGLMDRMGYAAPKISGSLEKKGAQVVMPAEGFFVKGTEGPLFEGELERAAVWAREIIAKSL